MQKKSADEKSSKLASTVDLHNSNIIVEALDKVVYSIVPNSRQYDIRINLLDVDKKIVVTTDINHSTKDWSITVDDKPVYDNGTIKYLTYSVSVNNKYYNSEKIIDISKDYKNYFKLVDSIKISNTKITKKDSKYIYSINPNSKVYDVRLDFVNSNNQVLLSKLLNHADKTWGIVSTEAPLSSGGQISTIKTYVSIDSKYYTSTQQIDVKAISFVDQDSIDETARQAELTRQAESARKAAADAVAKQYQQKSQTSQSVYYKNCDAVRAAGADPLYSGQPGYRSKLDRDSDGVACE